MPDGEGVLDDWVLAKERRRNETFVYFAKKENKAQVDGLHSEFLSSIVSLILYFTHFLTAF